MTYFSQISPPDSFCVFLCVETTILVVYINGILGIIAHRAKNVNYPFCFLLLFKDALILISFSISKSFIFIIYNYYLTVYLLLIQKYIELECNVMILFLLFFFYAKQIYNMQLKLFSLWI